MSEKLVNNEEIISKDKIEEIIKKYNIGKRPLSKILGWGEITISRYLTENFEPSKDKSDILYEILDNPEVYMEYLETNKELISNIAYSKSKTAVGKLMNINMKNDEKLDEVANYIIENNEETTNLSLQKLLYYTQVFSYVLYNRPAFNAPCDAWQHGPVFSDVYMKYKANGSDVIITNVDTNLDMKTKNLVDAIIDDFGCYSGKVLCYFTHSEEPWRESYNGVNTEISNEKIIQLAQEIKTNFDVNSIDDIKKYSFEMMKKFVSRRSK